MNSKIIGVIITMMLAVNFALPGGLGNSTGNTTSGSGQTLETFKEKMLDKADRLIEKIEMIQENVKSNQAISDPTENGIVDLLDDMIAAIEQYTLDVESAQSIQEITQATRTLTDFLRQNKAQYKEVMGQAVHENAENAFDNADEMLEQVEDAIPLLKVMCPEQISTIDAIEGNVDELETELDELEQAMNSNNNAQMKQEMAKMANTAKEIAFQFQEIEQNCAAFQQGTEDK
ncbi:hypothetical protein KJ780_04965 [Candidatus Micrarchaeota archaeon]|nr:hypothetical protein [Candidatus Micrarchaeota archaeon]